MRKILTRELNIGNLKFPYPLFASPLAGYSDKGYRKVLSELDCSFMFTEMVSSKALTFKNKKSMNLINILDENRDKVGIQIFGEDKDIMVSSLEFVESMKPSIIDVNMGCPAPKIVKNGEGSALILEPKKALLILESLCKKTDIPITVKLRKGFDEDSITSKEIIKELHNVGVKACFLHGRLREEYYKNKSDWDYIGECAEISKIPIIGNGDVKTPEEVLEKITKYGVDGVLVGRGFIEDPFLGRKFMEYLDCGTYQEYGLRETFAISKKMLGYSIEDKGEELAIKEMRKVIIYYLKGLKKSNQFRSRIHEVSTYDGFIKFLDEVLRENEEIHER